MMKLIIFFALMFMLVLGGRSDYRLEKVIELGGQENIADIVAVNETTFAVRTQGEVTLFQGPDFKPKEETIKVPKGTSKLTKHGLVNLEESGSFLQFRKFDQNITMMEDGLDSNMLVTSKYAILGKNTLKVPTLIKLDLNTFQKETISYSQVQKLSEFSHAVLTDLKNGQIAYTGEYFDLLFLDNETLQIKTALSSNLTSGTKLISVYKDEKKNQSMTLLERGIVAELKQDKSGNYSIEQRFNSFYYSSFQVDVMVTGMDTGVKLLGCSLDYLNNLRSIVHVSYDMQYFLKGRKGIALSNDETFFATRNDSGYYEFYRIGEDFSVNRFQSIYLSFNDLKKGKLTSDGKNMLVSMTNTRNKNDIAKIDIKEGEFYLITDQFGNSDNQHDFTLFNARYNRLVTLEFRGTSYYLQLRQLNTLDFVDEYQLKFDFQIAEYKLISGNDWNLTFGLALRIAPYSYEVENDTKLFMFKVEGDKIVSLNISANVSFNSLESCMKYVMTYKARFPLIKFLHISNLSLAFTIDAIQQYEVGIKFQKNIMLVHYYWQQTVFDLSNAPNNIRKVGQLSTDGLSNQITFVMADKGMFFTAPFVMEYYWTTFTKKFFNISSPIIKSNANINPNGSHDCHSATYYVPPQKTSPQCNFVFYIEYEQQGYGYKKFPQVVKYSQCEQTAKKYKVIEYGDYEVNTILFISSDKKYVLALVNPWYINEFLLEIRPIDAMEKIIFHKVFETYVSEQRRFITIDDYHVDIIRDNIILFHSPDFITVYFIEPKEFAEDHQMSKISHFDVNDRKVVALIGPALRDSSVTRVVVKEIASKVNMFETEVDSEVSIVTLSPLQERVAVYSKDSTLRVWNVPTKSIIFSLVIEKATTIKFEGENSFVVDAQEGKRRINFTKEGKYEYSGLVADQTATVKVKNGLISAVAANKLEVWTQKKTTASLKSEDDVKQLLQE